MTRSLTIKTARGEHVAVLHDDGTWTANDAWWLGIVQELGAFMRKDVRPSDGPPLSATLRKLAELTGAEAFDDSPSSPEGLIY